MKPKTAALLAGILGIIGIVAIRSAYEYHAAVLGVGGPVELSSGIIIPPGDTAIARAYRDRMSGMMVQSLGVVDRLLPDDEEGDRHQRFIIRLASGQTLLVSHNIDVAPRVPLTVGDALVFRGQYEWNEQGGVIHWTHRDPDREHPGGWIEHLGTTYE
jgi:hypothetical protein